jgi:hypothetical protein
MLRASVPEASIDENCDLCSDKCDVGASTRAWEGNVNSVMEMKRT